VSRRLLFASILVCVARAQEAPSGFELRTTLSGAAFYSHQLSTQDNATGPVSGGFRAMLYPVWKWNAHWSVEGAVQIHSQPSFFEEFSPDEQRSVKADTLQAHINYSKFWRKGSVVVRAGILSSAFGSFLRYDDAVNPLIDMPMSYGYYYRGITNLGLTGVQADATLGRFDFRAQFANSSPANRRNILESDQYGNWTGGIGYTIKQGLRVGASAYHGPYLSRDYAFFFPGELNPKNLPASAIGIDAEWGQGHWNVYGEWQKFEMTYHVIPTYRYQTGYAEVRKVLHPRWYVAARLGYLQPERFAGHQAYEIVVGFRPNRYQLVKAGYQIQQGPNIRGTLSNAFAVQIVTAFRALSIARD
jgi:hypothetical protein